MTDESDVHDVHNEAGRILKATGVDHDRTGCLYGCGEMGCCHPNLSAPARKLAVYILNLQDCNHENEETTRRTNIKIHKSETPYQWAKGPFMCRKQCPHRGLKHTHEMTVRKECEKCHRVVIQQKNQVTEGDYAPSYPTF